MPERISVAIDCDFGERPKSVMIASAGQTDSVPNSQSLERQVKLAVADWLRNTDHGRAAFQDSCHDFNAGDLANCLAIRSLQQKLAAYGIDRFELTAPIRCGGWYHDEHLFMENET